MPDAGGAAAAIGPGIGKGRSVEGRTSWVAAAVTLAILSFSYGSPLLIVVGLKPITDSLATDREVVALAGALVWVGTGLGGILMGWVADRVGVRWTVSFGGLMIGAGLAVSASGGLWALFIGHALLVGLLGNGALYPPLLVYVSRWFDRRRGTALALISSGQYVAGVIWPSLFEHAIADWGWRLTFLGYAVICTAAIIPLALLLLPQSPAAPAALGAAGAGARKARVLGLPPNLALGLICAAGFCCCVPMSVPSAHLVAYCSDLGIPPAMGAMMLSLMLGAAFISRQFWGWIADRIGGLRTVLAASSCQAVAIALFLFTQSEFGLIAVVTVFGLGFSGIIPAYVLAIRDLFPSSEAAWRVPVVLFVSMGGMAFGSWFAGALYDHFGYYAPAFATGVLFNLVNLGFVSFLVARQRGFGRLQPVPAE